MAVCAQEAQVLESIIAPIAVAMIKLDRCYPTPPLCQATHFALELPVSEKAPLDVSVVTTGSDHKQLFVSELICSTTRGTKCGEVAIVEAKPIAMPAPVTRPHLDAHEPAHVVPAARPRHHFRKLLVGPASLFAHTNTSG